ncbi:hypothetical protein BC830DRAFT_875560 [Chytriomyces sp. MP71]|nr:hypothetical protein BC830DRAFT_875560 [Chytriomyces sp. MP71]
MWSLSSRTPSAPSRLPSKPVRPSGPVGGVKGRGEGGSDYGCVLASSQLVLLSATPPHKTSFQALLLRTTDVNQMRSAAEMVLAAYHACNSVNHHSPHSKDPLPALSIFRTASVRATSASNTGSARASTASWSDRGGSAASATSATSLAASSRDADPVKALLLEREGAREAEALGHLAFAAVAGHALLVFVPIANHWVHPASNVDPVEHLARSLQEPWYLHMNHVARVFDETEINMKLTTQHKQLSGKTTNSNARTAQLIAIGLQLWTQPLTNVTPSRDWTLNTASKANARATTTMPRIITYRPYLCGVRVRARVTVGAAGMSEPWGADTAQQVALETTVAM